MKMKMNRKSGFSLIEIIFVLVLMTLLSAVIISSVSGEASSKSALVAQNSSIDEIKNMLSVSTLKNDTPLTSVTRTNAKFFEVTKMPGDFLYRLTFTKDSSGNTLAYLVTTPKSGTDDSGKQKLQKLVKTMDLKYDGDVDDKASGNFLYDNTCTATSGTTDCYYAVLISNDGVVLSLTPFSSLKVLPTIGDSTIDTSSRDGTTSLVLGQNN